MIHKKIKSKKLIILSLFIILLCSCSVYLPALYQSTNKNFSYRDKLLQSLLKTDSFDKFSELLFRYEVTSDSVTLSYHLKNPKHFDIPATDAVLTTFSYDTYEKEHKNHSNQEILSKLNKQLSSFPYKRLSANEQLTYKLLKKNFAMQEALCNYPFYEELLGATSGVQANLPVTLGEYPLRSEKDIQTYLSVLTQVPAYFDDVIAYEQKRSALGYSTPTFMRNDTIDTLDSLLAGLEQDNNCFVATFNERISKIKSLDAKKMTVYTKENQQKVSKYVIPAYQKLYRYLKDSVNNSSDNKSTQDSTNQTTQKETALSESSSRNNDYLPDPDTAYGLSTLPAGKQYYTLLAKDNTGAGKSVEEMITATDAKLQETISSVLNIALTDPKTYLYYCDHPMSTYYHTPESILEALSLMSRKNYPCLSDTPAYEIKSVPDSLATSLSPAFYMIPAFDDYQNNTIYINQLYTNEENGNLFTTLAHEGFPGHLYQTVYFNDTHPSNIRQCLDYPGYVEGWATYVEINSFDFVNYPIESANLPTLYKADTIISLALSARVDLGVNYEGWTLNDVNTFFKDNGFNTYHAADVYAYVVEAPATYLRYFIGYLEIEELKDAYQREKMEDFTELDFHKKFLDIGPADFPTIKEYLLH